MAWGAAAAAAIPAILSWLDKDKDDSTTPTTSSDPWSGVQKYLKGGTTSTKQLKPGVQPTYNSEGYATNPAEDWETILTKVPGVYESAANLYAQGPQQYYPGETYAERDPLQLKAQQGAMDFLQGGGIFGDAPSYQAPELNSPEYTSPAQYASAMSGAGTGTGTGAGGGILANPVSTVAEEDDEWYEGIEKFAEDEFAKTDWEAMLASSGTAHIWGGLADKAFGEGTQKKFNPKRWSW